MWKNKEKRRDEVQEKEKNMTFKSSRRRFIGVAAGFAAAGAASAVQAACRDPMPAKFDEMHDVVVVGSGFAGLAAALSAKLAGADVLVIEKMAFIGGNSSLSGGMIAVPGSSVQKAQGIKDAPENLAADMTRIGQGLGDPAHIDFLCKDASDTFEWTKKEMGVKWQTNLTGKGGHSALRCMITEEGTGQGIIKPAVSRLKALGVEIRTKAFMQTIIRDEDGRVKGLRVREGYVFGKPDSGTARTIGARRAVVLAFGGFCADVAYRKRLDPKLGEAFKTTNQPGATAEGWREASRIGANIIQADWIQCLPDCSPVEEGMGIASHFASISGSLFGLYFSSLDGKRFVNEFGDRKVLTDAFLAIINKGGKALAIADSDGVAHLEKLRPGSLPKMLEAGSVKRYDDAAAVAKAYAVPADAFESQIRRYNELLSSGRDLDFGRPFDKSAKPIGSGPFYVSEMCPKLHHAMGGMATTVTTAVEDVMTDQPIPGLFAAGECVGGIHGAVRIGACAVLDCLVNGRKAGAMAAAAKAWC